MTKEIDTPETVGELIDLLSKYPRDTKLDIYIVEIYDNGSAYPTSSNRMSVTEYDFSGGIDLTFGNGRTMA